MMLNDNIYKDLKATDPHLGFIIVNDSLHIEYFSDSIGSWFGPAIQLGMPLPEELQLSSPLMSLRYEGSEYIGLSLKIQFRRL